MPRVIISDKLDGIIRDLWCERDYPESFALMAIGGYGRATIHPQSDVDLLFFFKDAIDEESIKAVLHPLWDLQFKVGHQIRNADDLKEYDEGQIESYTAFLDCRLLLGDPATALDPSLSYLNTNTEAATRDIQALQERLPAWMGK